MASRALLSSAACACFFLAACSSGPFTETATYAQGYEAGCATAGAGLDPARASGATLASDNREYRTGWIAGLHCRDINLFYD